VSNSAFDPDIYLNRRAELWGAVKDALSKGELSFSLLPKEKQSQLTGELSAPKYKFTSKGQIQLEGKADMRKRGVKSPNTADALTLTYDKGLYIETQKVKEEDLEGGSYWAGVDRY
jgi:hypothetical protein